MKTWVAGVDIGGTHIRVSLGCFDARGHIQVVRKVTLSSRQGLEPKKSLAEIENAIQDFVGTEKILKSEFRGIGVSAAGAIDTTKGIVLKSPNLKKWEGFPLRKLLQSTFQVPIAVENDASAAALGELYFGAGKGIANFVYVTVSTGIGSGIVANGSLVRGVSGTAGELGHTTIVPNGIRCKCGKWGCLEAYGSGTAIARFMRTFLAEGKRSHFWNKHVHDEITGRLVSDACLKGDGLAIEARKMAATFLGIGLANIINILNPQRVILGGGVMENPRHFWNFMMERIKREAWPSALKNVKS